MRKPKNRSGQNHKGYTSPYPSVFSRNPQNLKRQPSTPAQKNWLEDTILYGDDDALPLRIAKAVEQSPAASACIDTRAQFIKGSGFTDKTLMKQKVGKSGETLWQLHCKLSDSLALFKGFAVNLKYNRKEQITYAYDMAFESLRFAKPKEELSSYIDCIKYNPYFGTDQFKKEYTYEYPVHDLTKLPDQLKEGETFQGQIYYYGYTSPTHRFYPVPRYWSAEFWIYVDYLIQVFHKKNLDNGFFQSVLMTVIGDPNRMSTNPRYQVEYTDENGAKRTKSTKTVGEEFNEMMNEAFSGADKAGNVMVQWAMNQNEIQKIQAFPSNTNADLFTTLQDLTTKNITIATKTPSILANISEGVSLGSSGSEIQKAVELMQANVTEDQQTLMDFYNDVLLPGMGISKKVELVNFNPVNEDPTIDDKVWEFLNEGERVEWIRKNYPQITLNRTVVPVVPALPAAQGEPAEGAPAPAPTGNSALKELKISEINKLQKIAARFNLGLTDPTNPKALTYEQAKQFLAGFGLTPEEIDAWLVKPEEIE